MISYIGDISRNDAYLLQVYAMNSKDILEFGCGASTQVLAAYTKGKILSIDTESSWMEKTENNLNLILQEDWSQTVDFEYYHSFMARVERGISLRFDFIFDDGADSLRRDFALKIWPYLSVGGVLAFHDTRRGHDFRNVLEVLAVYMDEVNNVWFNTDGSNITLIKKKAPEPYENWQLVENREPWQLGYDTPPQSFIDSLKK